jgi:hypothetical protein
LEQEALLVVGFRSAHEPHAFGGIMPIVIGSAHNSPANLPQQIADMPIGSSTQVDLIWNFDMHARIPIWNADSNLEHWNNCHEGRVVQNAERFRQYAEECRRLAKTAAPKDRAALLEIETAWIAVAEETERKEKAMDRGYATQWIGGTQHKGE